MKFEFINKYKFNHYLANFKTKKSLKEPKNLTVALKLKRNTTVFPKQLESIRRIISKPIKKEKGSLDFSHVLPTIQKSQKPLQTRMGKGKGRPADFFTYAKKNTSIVNILNAHSKYLKKSYIKRIKNKLKIDLKVIKRKIKRFIPPKQLGKLIILK